MPSTPTRRAVLRRAVVALGAAAGCVAAPSEKPSGSTTTSATGTRPSTGTTRPSTATTTTATATPALDTGTFADAPTGPEHYPERPESLTPESVRSYAAAFEYARTYNVLHERDAETVAVESAATYDVAADGGHYALAACSGYANYTDGVHADWGQLPAVYFVAEDLTVRVMELEHAYRDYRDVFAAEDPSENVEQPGSGRSAGYRVYNLDPARRDLSVAVEFLGGDAPETVFEADYEFWETGGVTQESVTYRRGEYRIRAALDSGARAASRWTVAADDTEGQYRTAVVVSPRGTLSVRALPVAEARPS